VLPWIEIAIIVPVYNEEDNILPLADEIGNVMDQSGRAYQILFVDDASTDATWDRIHDACQRRDSVRGMRHEFNAGQSAALWTGIRATCSPVIVTLDGDRQNDPADLPRLLAELQRCDFVCGIRVARHDKLASPCFGSSGAHRPARGVEGGFLRHRMCVPRVPAGIARRCISV
jgi:dolichol-phosphate mannosyltransferase